MYKRSLFERDEGGRIEMQPCTVEIFDRCQLMSAFTADFSCFSAFFSCFQLIQPDRYICSGSCCKQQQLTGFGFVLRHFSLRICMFWWKISLSQIQCLFSVKQFFDMKISLVLPEVFSFFLLPFQLYSALGKNQSFLHGFPNNVLVALE